MPSSSIAQIFLRLFALNWVLSGLIQIVSFSFTIQGGNFSPFPFVPALVYLVAGASLWAVSPRLSRKLAHQNDGECTLAGLTEQQLYAAVILGLGLYFALSSFAGAFSWIHFLTINKSPGLDFIQDTQPSYYDLSETFMTLGAGIFLTVTCKTWAKKLARVRSNGSSE